MSRPDPAHAAAACSWTKQHAARRHGGRREALGHVTPVAVTSSPPVGARSGRVEGGGVRPRRRREAVHLTNCHRHQLRRTIDVKNVQTEIKKTLKNAKNVTKIKKRL